MEFGLCMEHPAKENRETKLGIGCTLLRHRLGEEIMQVNSSLELDKKSIRHQSRLRVIPPNEVLDLRH